MNPSILICILALVVSLQAKAETLYIKDIVYVPIRSGPSSNHRILHKGLRSGTQLEFISTDEEENWYEVKTQGGIQGWIPKQYLSQTPTAQLKLNQVSKELAKKNTLLKKLRQEVTEKQNQLSSTERKLKNTDSEKTNAQTELAKIRKISSGSIELDRKYRKLLEEHEILLTRNDALNAENSRLKTDQRFSYMFYGAALIVAGMLLAVIIPRLRPKKRNSEWAS
jgi:SH3 domain protein